MTLTPTVRKFLGIFEWTYKVLLDTALTLTPNVWKFLGIFERCEKELVWTVNHLFVEAEPSRTHYWKDSPPGHVATPIKQSVPSTLLSRHLQESPPLKWFSKNQAKPKGNLE